MSRDPCPVCGNAGTFAGLRMIVDASVAEGSVEFRSGRDYRLPTLCSRCRAREGLEGILDVFAREAAQIGRLDASRSETKRAALVEREIETLLDRLEKLKLLPTRASELASFFRQTMEERTLRKESE